MHKCVGKGDLGYLVSKYGKKISYLFAIFLFPFLLN
jgi:hypothetical protein